MNPQRLMAFGVVLLSLALFAMAWNSFEHRRAEHARLETLRAQLDGLERQSATLHARVAQLEAARADGGVTTDAAIAAPH